MNAEISPEKIKRKVYISFFQDGLWDIVLGLFLLSWGCAIAFDLGWLPGTAFVAIFFVVSGLKQKVTYPRLGYFRPVGQRRQMLKLAIAGVIVLLLGIMVFLIIFTGGMPQLLHDYFELLFGMMLALVVLLIGLWWKIIRWCAYAGLMFIAAACNQWLGLSFQKSFLLPGAVICICGAIMLVRFLNTNSIISDKGPDEIS